MSPHEISNKSIKCVHKYSTVPINSGTPVPVLSVNRFHIATHSWPPDLYPFLILQYQCQQQRGGVWGGGTFFIWDSKEKKKRAVCGFLPFSMRFLWQIYLFFAPSSCIFSAPSLHLASKKCTGCLDRVASGLKEPSVDPRAAFSSDLWRKQIFPMVTQ